MGSLPSNIFLAPALYIQRSCPLPLFFWMPYQISTLAKLNWTRKGTNFLLTLRFHVADACPKVPGCAVQNLLALLPSQLSEKN